LFKFPVYFFVLILFVFILFGACGKRGEPSPQRLVVPVKIDDFRVEVAPGKCFLVWSLPTVNADKTRPVDLKSFKVRLKKLPVDQDSCRFCDEGFLDYLTLSLAKPAEGFVLGPSFYLPLPAVPYGFVYIYTVLSVNSQGWISEASNKLAVNALPEVSPPTNLVCHPSASVVNVAWQPSVMPVQSPGVLRYRVYRRELAGVNQAWRLITPEPIENSEYVDVGLSDWSSYEYVVTTFLSADGTFYESNFSLVAKVVPGDYSPPLQLGDFSAFSYQGGVQLIWSPSPAADLAGYHVYRRDNVTGIDQLVAVLPPSKHEFTDTNIHVGRIYYYRVTAFDQSDRNNESIPTPEVSVTVR